MVTPGGAEEASLAVSGGPDTGRLAASRGDRISRRGRRAEPSIEGGGSGTSFALVLGGGGLVGLAYEAGALLALDALGGIDLSGAAAVIGTSAGAIVGAYLRCGWTARELASVVTDLEGLPLVPVSEPHGVYLAGGAGKNAGGSSAAAESAGYADNASDGSKSHAPGYVPALGAAVSRSPLTFARRAIGSAYVLGRSAVRIPTPPLPARIARAFPGGMVSIEAARARLEHDLPEAWPEPALELVAFDLSRSERVVLSGGGAPHLALPAAVRASCAVPGIFPPVPAGKMVLVDGGIRSTTNLDLGRGHGAVICVAPMAYDPASPPAGYQQVLRAWAGRAVAREAAMLRRDGATVLLIRPDAPAVEASGVNPMRQSGLGAVVEAGYAQVAGLLGSVHFERFAERIAS